MRIVRQETINIMELGELLVIIPKGISPALDAGEWLDGQPVEVDGFAHVTTRAGRPAIRVAPGVGYALILRQGSGDRTWDDWDQRAPSRSQHGEVFAFAVATSHGGGAWFEVSLTPSAGYETVYEASIADELSV